MDKEQTASPDLAHTQFNYEATPNPEFKDPNDGKTLDQDSDKGGSSTSASPSSADPAQPTTQSVAAPAVTLPEDIIVPARPSELPSPQDESSEADFSDAVMRAKEIIVRTKDDPFAQNHEINELKARVMKQQFNKDIHTAGTP